MGRPPPTLAAATGLAVSGLLVLLTWTLFEGAARLNPADFFADTWFIQHQADALRQGGGPSYFLHSNRQTFYPVFAFYGGTLFVVSGAIALGLGSAATAQVVVYFLALAAAYGGWLWLGRQAGLRSWRAHAAPVLYVTAPYVLTNMYVRQDLAESVAAGAIPLLLASALSVARSDRLRAGPAAALAVSTVIFGASHNLTLLWGTTILVVIGLALAIGAPQARRELRPSGLLRVAVVAIPAMAVNAWYLLPELAYHADTVIAHRIDDWKALLQAPDPVVELRYLFALGRPSGFPGSGLTATLPVPAIAWAIAAGVIAGRRWRDAWVRTLAILALATVVLLVLMTHRRLLAALPDPWLMLQYGYRLETYVLFAICGSVIAGLVLVGRDHRRLTALLVPILVFSVVGAVQQIRGVPRIEGEIGPDIDRSTTFAVGDFADASMTVVPRPAGARIVAFNRRHVHRDRLDAVVSARPGAVLFTDLMTPPRMIDVHGARVIGRWALPPRAPGWQPRWYLALQVDAGATVANHARIVVEGARTPPVVAGRVISGLGLLGLAAIALAIVRAAMLRPSRRPR